MRRANRLRPAVQLDLFCPTGPEPSDETPEWRRLPEETQERVTRLMAQMLSERGARDHAGHGDGRRGDE